MSDLISRKAVMRKLFFTEDGRKYPTRDIDNFPVTVSLENLRKIIRNVPTAYDVEKVVEQLEKRKCSGQDAKENLDCKARNRHIDMCIRVVKGDGRDE